MKFGKLFDISNVDFKLPADASGTGRLLSNLPEREGPLKVYIGCTGWSMKEWIGKVYPPKTKAKDFLFYYSRQFNTIELNTTHYRTPDEKTIEKWKSESGDNFRFCPKILQAISHRRDLGKDNPLVDKFTAAVYGLEEKLGSCFMQLPPYFDKNRLPILINFLESWPKEIALGIEFRHESWFEDVQVKTEVFNALEENRIGTVITDVSGRRDVLHQRLTTPIAMIRFVGNGLHPTDYSRIDEWVSRLKDWADAGLKEVYFFPHEPDNILAPDLAVYFVNQLNAALDLGLKPPTLIGAFPEGQNPEGQISLF
ncbi:MAG: DUF72 domain-containing protein [Bacteroidota bacterium]